MLKKHEQGEKKAVLLAIFYLGSTKSMSGEMAEWLKAHAWKVCIPQKGIVGSNPTLSAKTYQNDWIYPKTIYICFFILN